MRTAFDRSVAEAMIHIAVADVMLRRYALMDYSRFPACQGAKTS